MALGNLGKGIDAKTVGIALLGGAAVAFFLSKMGKTQAMATYQQMANEDPNSIRIPSYGGVVKSRGFPDQSIKFNSLPSPSVEYLVPYDSSGLYANVAGAYDRCDSITFP